MIRLKRGDSVACFVAGVAVMITAGQFGGLQQSTKSQAQFVAQIVQVFDTDRETDQ